MSPPTSSLPRVDQLLQQFRRRAGMTQQQAAELAGVSLAGLRDLEQGRIAKPRATTLRRIATALALSAEETDELVGISLNPQLRGYDLWIQVLGPLSAHVSGVSVDPGPTRRRMLLGLLALAPNEPVARDSLLEWLWDSEPPETAVALLQTDVSRLRRRLLPRKPDASANRLVIATQSGYQLTLGDQQLDLLAFRKLASAAAESRKQGDLVGACEQFKQAVNLWRGEPLTNLPALRVHPATVALGRERQALVLDYASTAGELGRHSEVLPFLRDVAESDPLHENIHAALMIALAGSGQQAAALSVFTDLRNRLATELGADPGHELAQAHQRVLRHDLTRSEQPATATRAHRQLPRDIADFTGRETELSVLQARAARNAEHHTATTIANIVGMAGVGKTRLAVRLAHQLLAAGKYGDQQLYVDLHGHAPQPPADPNTVLASFLHLLDVPGDQIPQDLDSRAALYRDRLHGKNALVLLDNAATAEQVQPLLPAGATHLVLITSRRTLALDGTHTLPLDVLSPTDAKALLTHIVGPQRVNAEPTGTRDVIELCGRLPLAIALVAHRLQARPAWKFQDLAHRLHEASDRMSELAAGTRRVRAAFDLSYQALTTEAQTVFRLLGLHPGEDFTAASTAALAGHTPTHTRRVLDHLVDEHLVMVTNGDRYRLHDLLRDYARDLIKTEDTDHRTTALSRLLCWLSHSAVAARRWLLPEDPIGLPVWDAEPPYLPEFSDKDKALHWLDAESPTLANAVDAAIEHELPDAAWRLAIALQAHFRLTSDRSMWLEIGKKGLAAARAAGDSRGEGWALNDLGVAHAETGDLDTAAEFFAASVAIRTELGEQQTLCRAVGNLAFAHVLRDDYPKAISEFEKARRIAQEVGDVFFEAGLVNNLGEAYLRAGRYDEAIDQFRQGITMSDKEGQLRNRGLTRHGLGSALTQLDRHSEAVVPLREALELHRQAKSRADEGLVLRTLGIAFDGLGDTARAVQCWEQALELLDQLGHTFAADVRKLLADSVAST